MSLVYILAFPRVFADNGVFNSGPQTSVWVYVLWHMGFPVAILFYLWLDAKYGNVRYSARKAKLAGWCTFIGTIVLMAVCTLFTTHHVELLPTVLSQGQLSPAFVKLVGVPIVLLTFITLLIFYFRTKAITVTSTWLCVAIVAMMLDVIIVLCGGGRFSLGWYVAKWNSFICSNVVLAGMIYEFSKMYLNMADLFRKVKDSEYSYRVLLGESQQAERTISEQNTIIEQMLESSHEAIVMCDTVGRVILLTAVWSSF